MCTINLGQKENLNVIILVQEVYKYVKMALKFTLVKKKKRFEGYI